MEMTPNTPVQLCACGCGNPSGVYRTTRKSLGRIKGQPRRLLPGGHRPCNAAPYHRTIVNGRCRPLHVAIVEKLLGRELPRGVEVHHVDGNKRNNATSNLVVCPTRGYHRLLHYRQRIVDAGGNPNTQRICFKCQQLKFAPEMVGSSLKNLECRLCHTARSKKRQVKSECPHCHKHLASVGQHVRDGHCPAKRSPR